MGAAASVEASVDEVVASAIERHVQSVRHSSSSSLTGRMDSLRAATAPGEAGPADSGTPKEPKANASQGHLSPAVSAFASVADRLPVFSGTKPSLRSFALKKLSTQRNVYIPQEPNMVGSFMMRAGPPPGAQGQHVSGTSASSSSFQRSFRSGPEAIAEDVSHPAYFGDITMVSEHSSSEGSLLNRSGLIGGPEQAGDSHLMSMLDDEEDEAIAKGDADTKEVASPEAVNAPGDPEAIVPLVADTKGSVLPPAMTSISKLHGINLTIDVSARAPPPSDKSAVAVVTAAAKPKHPNLSLQIDVGPSEVPDQKKHRKPSLSISVNTEEDEKDWIHVSDDEEAMSPRAAQSKRLPPHKGAGAVHACQSYLFTKSGTIFVEGFSQGIGEDGIQQHKFEAPTAAASKAILEGPSTTSTNAIAPSQDPEAAAGGLFGPSSATKGKRAKFPITERLVLVCNLGFGASGVVYKALDLQTMRLVAVKMISFFDRNKRRQMVRELAALFSLLHQMKKPPDDTEGTGGGGGGGAADESGVTPSAIARGRDHIVDFYDAFSNLEDGGVALMMEYMNGGSLQDIVNDGGCQDEGTLASIALQVLAGLDFLHQCNQIHRDIKPANILINSEGSVKVSDLGILKQLDAPNSISAQSIGLAGAAVASDLADGQLSTIMEQPDKTASQELHTSTSIGSKLLELDEREIFRANTFVGTLTYMAPERIDGRSYTFNSDIWSFGLTLLAVALGKLPIDQSNGFWSILNCVRDLPPPSLPRDGTWSEECIDFIAQCLIQRPAKRPNCSELLAHPFLKKAVIENYDELTGDIAELRDSRIDELRSIIEALYLHLKKLRGDFENVKASRSLSTSQRSLVTVHILSQAIDSHGENEVLKFLLFGTPLSYRPGKNGSTGSIAAASGVSLASSDTSILVNDITFFGASERLKSLSKQLYIPLETTIEVAKAAYKDLINGVSFVRSRANSNTAALSSSRPTPTNMRNLRRFSRGSDRDEERRPSLQSNNEEGEMGGGATPTAALDPMHSKMTPKSRHDEPYGRK